MVSNARAASRRRNVTRLKSRKQIGVCISGAYGRAHRRGNNNGLTNPASRRHNAWRYSDVMSTILLFYVTILPITIIHLMPPAILCYSSRHYLFSI